MHSADFNMCALKNTKKMMPFAVKSITLQNSAYKHHHQDWLYACCVQLNTTRKTLHDGDTYK